MEYLGASQDIPLNERFYAGGPSSLRGFKYHRVGPLSVNRVPLGGRFEILWNVIELRRAVYKIIGVGVFADVGNVWADAEAASLSTFRSCVGAGIRANTSIGILRLDYSINTDPFDWEPLGQLYFSIGHAF